LAPKITKQNVTREKLQKKLPKRLTYEKGVHKTMMKLTPAIVSTTVSTEGTPTKLF
jgi:hypothetical protein